MKLLDAVNLVLPRLGERAVTSLEVKHPTLAILLPIVELTLRSALMQGWWFNEYEYTAHPNSEGEISLGADTLSFVPDKSDMAVQRGTRLFNPKTLSYVFTEPVKGVVVQYVEFDLLPEAAAMFVFYESLVDAFTTDLGVTQDLQIWQARSNESWSDLLSQHLKQRRHSTRKSYKWRRMINAMRG